MNLSDGISVLALGIASASLYFSLRKDANARQIRVIERKHQLFRLYDECSNSLWTARMYLPAIANLMSAEDRYKSEPDMRKLYRRLEVCEIKFREYEHRVAKLRLGEKKETHWRHVELEELVEETTRMFSEIEKITETCAHWYNEELTKYEACLPYQQPAPQADGNYRQVER